MTRTVKEMIEVMQASEKGAKIQARLAFSCQPKWARVIPKNNIVWDWDKYDFRVAPKPRVIELVEGPDGLGLFDKNLREQFESLKIIKFAEVMTDD